MINRLMALISVTGWILCLFVPNSSLANTNYSLTLPSNGITLPNDVSVLPDGTIVHGSRVITPSNTIVAGSTVYIPQGGPYNGSGAAPTLYSDRVVFSDGRQYYWKDRRIIMPDGTNILSDGRVISPDNPGETVKAQRGRLTDQGVELPGGTVIAAGLKDSITSARTYAGGLPSDFDTAYTAQLAQVLPASEMRRHFDNMNPNQAAAVFDAMGLGPQALANYASNLRIPGQDLGNIVDRMSSMSSQQMQQFVQGLQNLNFPSFQLEAMLGTMPNFMNSIGGAMNGFLNSLGFGGNIGNRITDLLGGLFGGGSGGGSGSGVGTIIGNSAYGGGGRDRRYESEHLVGEAIFGAKPPQDTPMPHITTPLASLIGQYSPYLYVKAVDQEDAPNDYLGDFYRDPPGSPRSSDGMIGFGGISERCDDDPTAPGCSVGNGLRLSGCIHQLDPPADYGSMSVEEKAAYNRLRLDNCANQYIMMSALFPGSVENSSLRGQVRNTAAESCQPLRISRNHLNEYNERRTTGPGGVVSVGKNYLRDYIDGAWKKLLEDPSHMIRNYAAPREPDYSYGGSNSIASGNRLRMQEELGTSGNLRNVQDLFTAEAHYEQIIDPTHPFSPRWDYQMSEREKYSPRAHEGWGADEKNSVYCAGSREMVDEWDCKSSPYGCRPGQDDLHDMAVHIMDFRAEEFEQHMELRMRWNERCKANDITRKLLDYVGCTWYLPFGVKIKWPCWHFFCMGAYGLHPLGPEKPPCAVRLGGKDTPLLAFTRMTVGATLDSFADVGQLTSLATVMTPSGIQQELGAASNGMFRNALASMAPSNLNMNMLLGNTGIQGLMGQLNPASMLSQFQIQNMFQMPNFQQMLGQVGLDKLQAQFGGIMNRITDLQNFQNVFNNFNPQQLFDFQSTQLLNTLKGELGLERFELLAAQGWQSITSIDQLLGPNGDIASFLANPNIAGMLDSQLNLQGVFTGMNPSTIFDIGTAEGLDALKGAIGADRFNQLQQLGQLEQAMNGTMEQLAGGQAEALRVLDDLEQSRATDARNHANAQCQRSDGSIPQGCVDQALATHNDGFLSQGLSGMSSFLGSSGVSDIVSQNPFQQTFGGLSAAVNGIDLPTFFQSGPFQTQIASGMESIGQMIGGADNLIGMAGNMDFIQQLQGMNIGGFFENAGTDILGTEMFKNFQGMNLEQLWGQSGFLQNLPNLPDIIDPSSLAGFMDNFDANKFINVDQFKDLMNNGVMKDLVGGEWMNKLNSLTNSQLKSFLENNPLSKVMGGNFMNALSSGELLQKLPLDKVQNLLAKNPLNKLSGSLEGITDKLASVDEALDFAGCGSRSINRICKDLTKPFGMLNKLKIAHYSAEKHAADPFSVELPLGVPEGLSFQEYFGVHRPYPAFHDTGREYGQSGDNPDIKQSTIGSEVAIVGVGRPTERCLFGGGGGAMSGGGGGGGLFGGFFGGGGSYVNVPDLDPITSWAELKLYKARSIRRGLKCITKFNKVWKPYFTEDPILFMDGVEVEVQSLENDELADTTVKRVWPEPWRGYCLDPDNNLDPSTPAQKRSFPYFPDGSASGITRGLDNAKRGDFILFRQGSAAGGFFSKPGLCTIGYVTGAGPASGDTPAWIRIAESNWGNYPDACGITDAVDPHPSPLERTLFKGNLNPVSQRRIQAQTGHDGSCADTNLSECALDSGLWNNVEVYDPSVDQRWID